MDQPVIVIGPQGIGGEDGFEFETQLCPTRFFATLQPFDVLAQEIASDPKQPRSDERRRIEPGLRHVEPQEDFLSHVVGIAVLQEPRSQVAIDCPLVPFDHGRKRRPVAPPKLLNQRLIDGGQQGGVREGGGMIAESNKAAGWYGALRTERNRVAIACASVRPVDRFLIGL